MNLFFVISSLSESIANLALDVFRKGRELAKFYESYMHFLSV